MTRHGIELSPAAIDRLFPHQVALRADLVAGKNYRVIYSWCEGLTLAPSTHYVRRDDIGYNVFCFADLVHADAFRERFNGERFNPAHRGRRSDWAAWRE